MSLKNSLKVIVALLALCPLQAWSQRSFNTSSSEGFRLTEAELDSLASRVAMKIREKNFNAAEDGKKDSVAVLDPVFLPPVAETGDMDQDSAELEEFSPDIESVTFVPKGQIVAGVSVGYTMSNQNKYQFLVLEGISGDTYAFQIAPMFCYIFANDMGAGGKFAYSRSLTKLENADIVLDPETSVNIEHLYRLSHNYTFTGIFRNYFSLGRSKRFGIFNETQLSLGGGQSKLMTGSGKDLSGVYETSFNFNVGLSPGLVMFITNYSAIEVNVGVLGFSYSHTKSLRDQVYESHRKAKMANFHINLFSISFGVSWYI